MAKVEAPAKPTADSEMEWRADSFASDTLRTSEEYQRAHKKLKAKFKSMLTRVKNDGLSEIFGGKKTGFGRLRP